MPLMRLLGISLLSFLLTACGGGGSLEKDGSISDGDSTTETSTYTISLKGYLKASDTESNSVTADAPLELRASLVNEDGDAVSGERITFTLADSIGELDPVAGTALTQSDGVATIELIAGSSAGAGEVTATFTIDSVSYTDTFAFESDGTASTEPQLNITAVNSSGENTRNVDYSNPLTVQVELEIDGEPAAFKLVEFVLTGLGTINPTNGTALTNAQGIATISLLAGTEVGAGSIVATYTDNENIVYSSDGYTFTTEGDAPVQGESLDFSIGLSLTSSTSLTEISTISAADSGVVKATVLDGDGIKVEGAVVNFSSTLGNLIPSIGTALTNENGIASLNLTSGTVEGAGLITAQYEGVEKTLGFYTRGDAVNPDQSTADINFKILQNCPVDFKTTRDASLCEEVTSISGDSSAILFIEVTNEDSTTPLTQALVTATTTIGSITPSTGTAITDANGIALLDIVPGQDVGAGEITVSVLDSNLTKAFQIAAVDIEISISSSIADDELLAAGATALISIEISKDGELYTTPLTVEFSSGCVSSGQASIDETVTSIGGFARSTYRPLTCVGGDIITATVITGGDTVSANTTINVSPANIGFLQFIDVTEPVIALKGTGGADRTEISEVTFKLVDSNGNDLASRTVNFELSTAVGGITLGTASAITNASGEVKTSVLSGSIATPVRVIASSEEEVEGNTVVVTAPSDILVVSTGIADQNSFSLSRSIFNPHALNVDGNTVAVNARLADHFNNPVPDGTAVTFITEGGVIEPSCTTTNGACSVTWTSSNPRPFTDSMYENTIAQKCDGGLPCPLGILNNDLTIDLPLGGRATVHAYAIGEETFSDLNGNGYFDSEDFFDDLFDIPEAFIDNNEDGTFGGKDCSDGTDPCSRDNSTGDEFEEFVDFDGNGSWTTQNGLYNGLLCREEDETAGLCSRQLVNVFQNQEIVMSGDAAFFRLVTYADDCSAIAGVTASEVHINSDPASPLVRRSQADPTSQQMCQVSEIDLTQTPTGTSSVSLIMYIADMYNNPMPAGTEVSISTDNGEITGETSYVFPNTTSFVPVGVSFGIKREPLTGGNDSPSGSLNISVEAPSGLVSPFSVSVVDDL
ncbi:MULTISPECIES: Ig-like domain-containing protein [unclassified Pseudoalteromonas]|uniref:Ig-like domain-containing protein n=1 Tax=unclassified Pseudoalteromonas TaxID=194690 RepID=UPI0015FFD5A3|nr:MULTISPECIES: Ig-like domain-containing protein [unclassified Pseudoalteromonas]MBB1324255.1 Ig-like domain-containing protein [Pseudoalteromonas sp. SR45-1]MBB1350533.1 Ig-like domain-containing protein [Pseudoalteromonas sp. SG45-3]MBB1360223.1 Ig-like domain-containing protein [Pseudoalteromonas sp. SG45-6]MBB1450236.1 Ig-like domain-containing protein [Pseudoalteromonas sp. SG43-1]